jgi:oxygen-independent coproporphyrinogen-3 oxidase
MDSQLIAKYDRAIPRYTSYPTAPHFHAGIGPATYADWLSNVDVDQALSLYLHVPYCKQMCWYCGCHTKIVARYAPVADFVTTLHAEIDLIADLLAKGGGGQRRVTQIHWGGGTPNVMTPADFRALMKHLAARFDFTGTGEYAVELDPRWVDVPWLEALRQSGINRVSLGVQDFDVAVQAAINRLQPFEMVRDVMAGLRDHGIQGINLDLIYGLPSQSLETLHRTVDMAASLRPDRISLFGYAHVPWMKANQRQIDEAALPNAGMRWQLQESAAGWLSENGYRSIGLDHFALPDDELALALDAGKLQRNFQGYTTDDADCLIGLGPSAIGSLPQGYVQNAPGIQDWARNIQAGQPAAARGIVISSEDHLRRLIITRLMCDGYVDLDAVRQVEPTTSIDFAADIARLQPLISDGLVQVVDQKITITDLGRPLMRVAAACFDAYLQKSSVQEPVDGKSDQPQSISSDKPRRYSRAI